MSKIISRPYNEEGEKTYERVFGKRTGAVDITSGLRSLCCDASVKIEGRSTHYYVCQSCGKACDTK